MAAMAAMPAEEAAPEVEALEGTGLPSFGDESEMPTFDEVRAAAGIFPAKAKPRLTEDERLARECERRRQQDTVRRARLFDAKRRAIGLDMETLDAQVRERKAREEAEKAQSRAEAQDMLRVNQMVKQAEAQKMRERKEAEREAKDFSLQNLHFASRREYDLNDPQAKKKDQPGRVGDLDPRCGVSSMQKFQGEDLMKDERMRQQRMAMASWVEQQRFEKAALKAQEKGVDESRAQYVNDVMQQVDVSQGEDADFRQSARNAQCKYNVDKSIQNAKQRETDKINEKAANDAELNFHNNDPFLTETGKVILETGRKRRDAFKGSDRAERKEVQQQQLDQAAADAERKAKEKAEELAFQREAEMTRKQLVAMERDKQRSRRAAMEKMAQENLALKEAQAQKKNYLDAVLHANVPTDDYFNQFGRGCR